MKVAVTGASGLIGGTLKKKLIERGDEVFSVTRSPKEKNDIFWDIKKGEIERKKLDGVDGVVHLAGEPIFGLRWTEAKKEAIRDSRVKSTRLLVDTFREMDTPPEVFVCGSAVGIYGDRDEVHVDETDAPGSNFLALVCKDWESEAKKAETFGVRVARARTGLVLSSKGGILSMLERVFSLGLGGKLGSGEQGMSWISLDDEVGALTELLSNQDLSGPFNLSAPNPVSNARFTKKLADVLNRPSFASVPAFAIRLALGELGEELLLSGVYAEPRKLTEAGYIFKYPTLTECLEALLKD